MRPESALSWALPLARRIVELVPLLFSLGVHEWAHAFMAFRLGDTTAEEQGRLTPNPLAHIDLVGTLLLPLLGLPFGWATPVPVDPARFHRRVPIARGMLLVAAAGPIANIAAAATLSVCIGACRVLAPRLDIAHPALAFFASKMITFNLALAVFNFLPVPPLDGSRVVEALLPFEWRGSWSRASRYGTLLLIVGGLVYCSGRVAG